MDPDLLTPCVRICTIDRQKQHCRGCRRTLAEIAEWGPASLERRQEILNAARARG